jgi:hypothetical protein
MVSVQVSKNLTGKQRVGVRFVGVVLKKPRNAKSAVENFWKKN